MYIYTHDNYLLMLLLLLHLLLLRCCCALQNILKSQRCSYFL